MHTSPTGEARSDGELGDQGRRDHGPSVGLTVNAPPARAYEGGKPNWVRQWAGSLDDPRIFTGWRRIVLNFAPSWFAVNMGTGVTSILLYNAPYRFPGQRQIGLAIFALNAVLFLTFLAISVLRYYLWPPVFGMMLRSKTQSFFCGCFSMGLSTLVNMLVFSGLARSQGINGNMMYFVWALWWFNAVISIIICIGIPLIMFEAHGQTPDTLQATWLLPAVSPIVSSATGGVVAEVLPDQFARYTLIACYIIWGIGFLPSFVFLGTYYVRLAMYRLPPAGLAISAFLPVGPCGQGAFALLQFSRVGRDLALRSGQGIMPRIAQDTLNLPGTNLSVLAANIVFAGTIPVALAIWGLGAYWLTIAVSNTLYRWRVNKSIPFNIGWWGLTFPLGVFTTATIQLAVQLDSNTFRVLGTIFVWCETVMWTLCSCFTVSRALCGTIFVAPCLEKIVAEMQQRQAVPQQKVG